MLSNVETDHDQAVDRFGIGVNAHIPLPEGMSGAVRADPDQVDRVARLLESKDRLLLLVGAFDALGDEDEARNTRTELTGLTKELDQTPPAVFNAALKERRVVVPPRKETEPEGSEGETVTVNGRVFHVRWPLREAASAARNAERRSRVAFPAP